MCLLEIERNGYAVIDRIDLDSNVKNRLISLGLARNTRICVKQYGCCKSTVQLMVDKSFIALRKEEAQHIEVIAA